MIPYRASPPQGKWNTFGGMVSFASLPMPPPRRRLSRVQAAAYCGISPTLFDEEVRAKRYPPPIRKGKKGGRSVWDLKVLDAALDAEAGLTEPSSATDPYLARLEHGIRRAARD